MARWIGSSGCSRGVTVSSRYSLIAFDSNNVTLSSMVSVGTFLCGEIARNQSGRLSGSMWRNSNGVFFSRRMIAERCTHGQVLKLTSMYFAMISSLRGMESPSMARGRRGIKHKSRGAGGLNWCPEAANRPYYRSHSTQVSHAGTAQRVSHCRSDLERVGTAGDDDPRGSGCGCDQGRGAERRRLDPLRRQSARRVHCLLPEQQSQQTLD